ncbi:hypothetical protein GCM10020260_09790 [Nesterenkonia halobia]|uniref:Uncharacterized protein n=1 Tax=Nesterenkonia halobia TaxID=37922 RepID=A0ABP6RAH1_9MICC
MCRMASAELMEVIVQILNLSDKSSGGADPASSDDHSPGAVPVRSR